MQLQITPRHRHLSRARLCPSLPFTLFCPQQLVQATVGGPVTGNYGDRIQCLFVSEGPLSDVAAHPKKQEVTIYLHDILNHQDTPALVLQYLVKHELLHLQVDSEPGERYAIRHPEMYVQIEKRLCPERLLVWTWIYVNLGEHLAWRRLVERIDVLKTWRDTWQYPRLDMAQSLARRHKVRKPCRMYQ